MGCTKHYLNNVICECSEESFGQDAIEWAIQMGHVKLTMDRETDFKSITAQYDDILDAYRVEVNRNEALLVESYGPIAAAVGAPISRKFTASDAAV
jgi:hypothetical protein